MIGTKCESQPIDARFPSSCTESQFLSSPALWKIAPITLIMIINFLWNQRLFCHIKRGAYMFKIKVRNRNRFQGVIPNLQFDLPYFKKRIYTLNFVVYYQTQSFWPPKVEPESKPSFEKCKASHAAGEMHFK